LSVRPLIRLTFLCLGAIVAQLVILPILLVVSGAAAPGVASLFGEHALFFSVRVLFGLLVPLAATVMVWRTARIRSLDSATGLLYVVATLILAGEIIARSLFFLTGVAT
jgi:DMSO reductase anchor subunit